MRRNDWPTQAGRSERSSRDAGVQLKARLSVRGGLKGCCQKGAGGEGSRWGPAISITAITATNCLIGWVWDGGVSHDTRYCWYSSVFPTQSSWQDLLAQSTSAPPAHSSLHQHLRSTAPNQLLHMSSLHESIKPGRITSSAQYEQLCGPQILSAATPNASRSRFHDNTQHLRFDVPLMPAGLSQERNASSKQPGPRLSSCCVNCQLSLIVSGPFLCLTAGNANFC